MPIIQPTPGDVVHYHPKGTEAPGFSKPATDAPVPGLVTFVWDFNRVNLTVFDAAGVAHSRQSTFLCQPDAKAIEGESYACWTDSRIKQEQSNLMTAALNEPDPAPKKL